MNVSIVVVQRERFTSILESLRSLFETVPETTPVIVVEGMSPPQVRQGLEALRAQRPFTWVPLESFVTPQEARNIGFEQVTTEYVVFADNDIVYEPGWLRHLEENAREHASDVVSPVTCIGPPSGTRIHHAGGDLVFEEDIPLPHVRERHRLENQPISMADTDHVPVSNEVAEFHCFLARSDFIRRVGPLDERLITREHVDFALRTALVGGKVTFERRSVVTYTAHNGFDPVDLPYHLFRWSDPLALRSLSTFKRVWEVATDTNRVMDRWIRRHRLRAVAGAYPEDYRRLGQDAFNREIVEPLERSAWEKAMETRTDQRPAAVPPAPDPGDRARLFASRLGGSRSSETTDSPVPDAAPGGIGLCPVYAQTNLQLYNQLRRAGYPESEQIRVSDAYTFAMEIFAGQYRANGKPFISHLVGTASVLATQGAPVEVLAAGLLHAAYSHGSFQGQPVGITEEKRARVRSVLDPRSERLIWIYSRMPWTINKIGYIHERLHTLNARQRYVVLIRLANELEDHLDLGMLYGAKTKAYTHNSEALKRVIEMTREIGSEQLAEEVRRTLRETAKGDVPMGLHTARRAAFAV